MVLLGGNLSLIRLVRLNPLFLLGVDNLFFDVIDEGLASVLSAFPHNLVKWELDIALHYIHEVVVVDSASLLKIDDLEDFEQVKVGRIDTCSLKETLQIVGLHEPVLI